MEHLLDNNPQYDYNVYKVPQDRIDDFIHHIRERGFVEIQIKSDLPPDIYGLNCHLFFCDKDSKNGCTWIRLLSKYTLSKLTDDIRIYGAALIYTFMDVCFVISYGNAHFYVNSYCDYDFGTDVAERLINFDLVKTQQNLSKGSKTSRTHIDYIKGATLTYGSGEIPNYIRGISINEEEWGKIINCGTAAQFKWPEEPLDIGPRLLALNSELQNTPKVKLPRIIRLKLDDYSKKISTLNIKLAKAIIEYDPCFIRSNINIPSLYLVGTKYFQNDFIGYTLSCRRKTYTRDGELSIESLQKYVSENNINLDNDLESINVKFMRADGGVTPWMPLLNYLDFVTDDNYCLFDGVWCYFNTEYLERIWSNLKNLPINNHVDDEYSFSFRALDEYATSVLAPRSGTEDRKPYETYYNRYLAEKLGGNCNHPSLLSIEPDRGRQYALEPFDICINDKFFYVKIGETGNFACAIDQVNLALDLLDKQNGIITLGQYRTVKKQRNGQTNGKISV